MNAPPRRVALDLERDQREDYCGKRVVLFGAEYEVGPLLGIGGEKVVHQLTNVRSGWTGLTIRIWGSRGIRDGSFRRRDAFFRRMLLDPIRIDKVKISTIDCIEFEQNSGFFQVTPLLPAPIETPQVNDCLAAWRWNIAEGRFQVALEGCNELLRQVPFHPLAMHYKVLALHGLRQGDESLSVAFELVASEPCDRSHLELSIRLTRSMGLFIVMRQLVDEYVSRFFPYPPDMDPAMLDGMLVAGAGPAAESLIERRFESLGLVHPRNWPEGTRVESPLDEYVTTLARCSEERRRAMSAVQVLKAMRTVARTNPRNAAERLAVAHSEAPHDMLVEANLAICLAMSGDLPRAASHFVKVGRQCAEPLSSSLLVNAGFCLMLEGKAEPGLRIVGAAVAARVALVPGQLAVLPGVLVWVEADDTVEQSLSSALTLIDEGLSRCSPDVRRKFAGLRDAYQDIVSLLSGVVPDMP